MTDIKIYHLIITFIIEFDYLLSPVIRKLKNLNSKEINLEKMLSVNNWYWFLIWYRVLKEDKIMFV